VVDPGDAAPVARRLAERGLELADILVTHHHGDHIGGVADLVARTGARVHGPAGEPVGRLDTRLAEGDRVRVLGVDFDVLDVPGHTRGHIAYHAPSMHALFCGDTLFACGCGRLFEGTAAQMTQSLAKLAALPGDTRVYCAHEYTLANIRFARTVEPGNERLARREAECRALREQGIPTVPSTIGLERETNPFLRCDVAAVRAAARARDPQATSTTAVFAAIRTWKDGFRG
jgi:hydroxyacylglutathione hydrolase